MVFPFGVSVGDFISGIKLICDSIQALNDAHGASSQYQQLLSSLQSLQAALLQIDSLQLDPSMVPQQQAIRRETESCRQCVNHFLMRIDKYRVLQISTEPRWSIASVKGAARKIQWGLFKKEDVASFQNVLSARVDSIQMLLLTFQVASSQLQEKSIKTHINTTKNSLAIDVDQQFSTQLALSTTTHNLVCEQQRQLGSIESKVDAGNTTMQNHLNALLDLKHKLDNGLSPGDQRLLFSMVCQSLTQNGTLLQHIMEIKSTLLLERCMPPQVPLQEPVILHDALGRATPFHLDFINSSKAFIAVLRVRFEHKGIQKIERDEFLLEDAVKNRELSLRATPWESLFKPGQYVNMSMIFQETSAPWTCPSCSQANPKECDSKMVKCTFCSLEYRKTEVALTPRTRKTLNKSMPQVTSTSPRQHTSSSTVEPDISDFTRVLIRSVRVIQKHEQSSNHDSTFRSSSSRSVQSSSDKRSVEELDSGASDFSTLDLQMTEMKYLDLLQNWDHGAALTVLREELTPVYLGNIQRLHYLSSLMMSTPEELHVALEAENWEMQERVNSVTNSTLPLLWPPQLDDGPRREIVGHKPQRQANHERNPYSNYLRPPPPHNRTSSRLALPAPLIPSYPSISIYRGPSQNDGFASSRLATETKPLHLPSQRPSSLAPERFPLLRLDKRTTAQANDNEQNRLKWAEGKKGGPEECNFNVHFSDEMDQPIARPAKSFGHQENNTTSGGLLEDGSGDDNEHGFANSADPTDQGPSPLGRFSYAYTPDGSPIVQPFGKISDFTKYMQRKSPDNDSDPNYDPREVKRRKLRKIELRQEYLFLAGNKREI
ncbi:hypothetical protein EJ08DRAFT_648083 [Tothia fuscella]|uniref:Ubiquitin-like domain-containing protein n=1 Tax=Tothia fuscella TaxID=1048955 RepID=A0A9P4U155_9PEZI|nr:hypothetical protein EJ08DRAFT_648083 [Tothia fuscella]